MDFTKPYRFRWFGDTHGPKPYKVIGFRWAFKSQTPIAWTVDDRHKPQKYTLFQKQGGRGNTDLEALRINQKRLHNETRRSIDVATTHVAAI